MVWVPGQIESIDLTLAIDTTKDSPPAGVNEARKVPCKKSEHHGFHPEDEACPLCDPEPPTAPGWHWYNGTYAWGKP